MLHTNLLTILLFPRKLVRRILGSFLQVIPYYTYYTNLNKKARNQEQQTLTIKHFKHTSYKTDMYKGIHKKLNNQENHSIV